MCPEARQIIWHKTCKCVCRLTSSICSSRQIWNEDKCRCERKKDLIDKGICNKEFTWNPSSYGFECDKSCGIGRYLDYKNCVYRNSIIDKSIEECTGVVDGDRIYNETLNTILLDDCGSCTLCCIICSIFNNKYNNWWCFCLLLLAFKKKR